MKETLVNQGQHFEAIGIVGPESRSKKLQEMVDTPSVVEPAESIGGKGTEPEYELFEVNEYGDLGRKYKHGELYQDERSLKRIAKFFENDENTGEKLTPESAITLLGLPKDFSSYELDELFRRLTSPYYGKIPEDNGYLQEVFRLAVNDITSREIQEIRSLSQSDLEEENQERLLSYLDYYLGTPSAPDHYRNMTIGGLSRDFTQNAGIPHSFLEPEVVDKAADVFLLLIKNHNGILSRADKEGRPIKRTWSSLSVCLEKSRYLHQDYIDDIINAYIENVTEMGIGPELDEPAYWDALTAAAETGYLKSEDVVKLLEMKDVNKGKYKQNTMSHGFNDNPDFYTRRLLAAVAIYEGNPSTEYFDYLKSSLDIDDAEIATLKNLIRYYQSRNFYDENNRYDRKKALELGETDIMQILKLEEKLPGSVSKLEKVYGIKNFGRYPADSLLDQAKEEDIDSSYGIVLYPYSDWNGAFHQGGLFIRLQKELEKYDTKIRFAEAGSKIDLARRMITFDKKYGSKNKMSFAILGGHGTQSTIQFGERYYGENSTLPELSLGDITGKGVQRAASGEFFEEGATIILKSCSTGAKEGIAQEISKVTSGEVIGPEKPTALRDIEVREVDGKLVFDVTYNDADSKNYVGGEPQTDRTIAPPKKWW